jgi:hypothetical protein
MRQATICLQPSKATNGTHRRTPPLQLILRIKPAFSLLVGYSLSVASDTIAACIRLHYLVMNVGGIKDNDNVTFEQVEEHGPP